MAQQQKPPSPWSAPWITAVAVLGCVAVVVAERARILPLTVWVLPFLAAAGGFATWLLTLIQDGRLRTHAHRILVWIVGGAWVTWAAAAGWTQVVYVSGAMSAVVLTGLSYVCRTPPPEQPADTRGALPRVAAAPDVDPRPARERGYEALLRRLTNGTALRVNRVVPWERPDDGERVHIQLPLGMTWRDIADLCDRLAAALHLPPGCAVRALEGAHQGEAVLDVMRRDCLADKTEVEDDFSAASINDEFPILTTPRGEKISVCLRIMSMVVGGTTGSGKTTFLNRVILWLARCVDVLIWVIDLNGGGVAAPWIEPWALGKANRPIIDWIADTEEEAAVMVAVAAAEAKERKTSAEARRRKKAANDNVLPVDRDMPAIVILTDEGGEVRQAVSLLGQLVGTGISRVAQIGRAEGVRVIMSVLRGTSDLLDKALRVVAGIRVCLRMEEEDEYGHVLGTNPGRTRLVHVGTAYLRRSTDPKPIFGRTDDMSPDMIERAAIACASLRPVMPESGLRAAAKVRVRDVLGGRDPAGFEDLVRLPVMRDVEAGRAYTGRWDRYAYKLAEMRGDDLPEPEEPDEPTAPAQPAISQLGSPALAALAAAAGISSPPPTASASARRLDLADKTIVDQRFDEMIAGINRGDEAPEPGAVRLAEREGTKVTTREHILAILTEVHPETLTSAQIGVALNERSASVSRQYRQDVLKQMRESGEVVQISGAYTVRPK
jgi:hypothetical protein